MKKIKRRPYMTKLLLIKAQKMIGKRFGCLTITRVEIDPKGKGFLYFAICDCGKEKGYKISKLRLGEVRSCGCLMRKLVGERSVTHGLSKHPLHGIWHGMKMRCRNHPSENCKHYGRRGIIVCDEWKNDFKAFYDWAMANGWELGLQIDRRNNDGNYEPSNCRFVTSLVNNNNTSQTNFYEVFGEKLTRRQICDKYPPLKWGTLRDRLMAGWDIYRAIQTPVRKKRHHSRP